MYKKIDSQDGPLPDGSGILNRLFRLQSSIEKTDECIFLNEIKNCFFEISSGCSFHIKQHDADTACELYFSKSQEAPIKAEGCGLGLQHLLIFSYYLCDPSLNLLLIEEPENHIHPEIQRSLIRFLKHKTGEKQFVISTHSNIFLDLKFADRIYFTEFYDSIEVSDKTSRASMLAQLGYSPVDNLTSDLLILTEGSRYDRPIIEK